MSSTADSGSIVKLISMEEKIHEVPIEVAKMSGLVKESIDSDENDNDDDDDTKVYEVPVQKVRHEVLEKVIEFCQYYKEKEQMTTIQVPLKSSKVEDVVQKWYAEYVKVEAKMLFELIMAAHYMDIKPLLDVTCLSLSELIRNGQITTNPLDE